MYAVIADTHLGHLTKEDEDFFFFALEHIRQEGLSIIWLGDIFDLIWDKDAYAKYSWIIQPNDKYIVGNHDFPLFDRGIGQRALVFGNYTVLVHGDYLDFGFFTARMQSFWHNFWRGRITLLELIAKILYPYWQFTDVHDLFRLMTHLGKETLDLFSHSNLHKYPKYVVFYKLFRLLAKLRKYLEKDVDKGHYWEVPVISKKPEPSGELLGYFTHRPQVLYDRFRQLYYPFRDMSEILVGHIHIPASIQTSSQARFTVVGAWQRNEHKSIFPTVPILDTQGHIIEIREYR